MTAADLEQDFSDFEVLAVAVGRLHIPGAREAHHELHLRQKTKAISNAVGDVDACMVWNPCRRRQLSRCHNGTAGNTIIAAATHPAADDATGKIAPACVFNRSPGSSLSTPPSPRGLTAARNLRTNPHLRCGVHLLPVPRLQLAEHHLLRHLALPDELRR